MWVICLLLGLAIVTFAAWRAFQYIAPPRLHSEPRRAWKDQAVRDITARTQEDRWVQNEINRLRTNAANNPGVDTGTWMSPSLILMTNGDWIVYTNVCNKQNRRIHDLLIGRGSDNKWYYSTYHFCINMIVLRMRADAGNAPSSLNHFAKEYYLREFDGRSDDSLQKTWPPKRN
jgi:hypothetical protein